MIILFLTKYLNLKDYEKNIYFHFNGTCLHGRLCPEFHYW